MLFLSRFSLPFLKIYAITEYSLMVLDIFQDFQMQSCLHNNFGVVPLRPQEYTTIFSALTTYLIILKWTGTTCGRKEKKKKRVILEVNILRILGSYRQKSKMSADIPETFRSFLSKRWPVILLEAALLQPLFLQKILSEK